MMKFDILTLFPEIIDGALNSGILKKAMENGLFEVKCTQIRDFSTDKHHKTDDYSFGGGAGMIMTPQPIHDAINSVDCEHKSLRIYMSPRGNVLNQNIVKELSGYDNILILCGSYEGVDQRIIDADIDREISIGDYVLTSGELPAVVLINAVVRYIPGVLGSEQSTDEESFSENLLEYPQYTRPQNFLGMEVPEVLTSGDHEKVRLWRYEKALEITKRVRPDLLDNE